MTRMGDIGEPKKEGECEPIRQPIVIPTPQPEPQPA